MGRVARLGSEWHKWPAGRRFLLNLQMTDLARVKLAVLKAGTEGEIDATFVPRQLQAGALVVDPDAFMVSRREQLVALTSRCRSGDLCAPPICCGRRPDQLSFKHRSETAASVGFPDQANNFPDGLDLISC
jgi:hypothetical protein